MFHTDLVPSDQQLLQLRQLRVSKLQLHPCSRATLLKLLRMERPPVQCTAFCNDEVISDTVAALLPSLPRLERLETSHLHLAGLSSLAFLSTLPALRTLRFSFMGAHGYANMQRVDSWLRLLNAPLQQLTLLDSLNEGLDELSILQLTPPSTLVPSLGAFEYTPNYRW